MSVGRVVGDGIVLGGQRDPAIRAVLVDRAAQLVERAIEPRRLVPRWYVMLVSRLASSDPYVWEMPAGSVSDPRRPAES